MLPTDFGLPITVFDLNVLPTPIIKPNKSQGSRKSGRSNLCLDLYKVSSSRKLEVGENSIYRVFSLRDVALYELNVSSYFNLSCYRLQTQSPEL